MHPTDTPGMVTETISVTLPSKSSKLFQLVATMEAVDTHQVQDGTQDHPDGTQDHPTGTLALLAGEERINCRILMNRHFRE